MFDELLDSLDPETKEELLKIQQLQKQLDDISDDPALITVGQVIFAMMDTGVEATRVLACDEDGQVVHAAYFVTGKYACKAMDVATRSLGKFNTSKAAPKDVN